MRFDCLLLIALALYGSGCRAMPSLTFWNSSSSAVCESGACVDCYGVEHRPCWYPSLHCTSHVADDFVVRMTARKCANRALNQFRDQIESAPSSHFQSGFIQAYMEIAEGYPGRTPPIPPREYWKAYHRTTAGQQAAHEWFKGYTAGAQHAQAEGLRQKIVVASSYRFTESLPFAAHSLPFVPGDGRDQAPPEPVGTNPVFQAPNQDFRDENLAPLPDLSAPYREPAIPDGIPATEDSLQVPRPDGRENESESAVTIPRPETRPSGVDELVPRLGRPVMDRRPEFIQPAARGLILPPTDRSSTLDGSAANGRLKAILFGHSQPVSAGTTAGLQGMPIGFDDSYSDYTFRVDE